jgi:hypothetical protein
MTTLGTFTRSPLRGRSVLGRLLLFVASVASLGVLGWIVLAAVLIYQHATTGNERAAALQAVAAGASLVATVMLLAVTAWYAVLTRGILKQSGPIVAATLRVGWLGSGAALTGPLSTLKSGPVDERYTVPSFAITVRNSGNAATKVNSVAVASEAGFSVSSTKSLAGPTPTFTLDAHSSETVYMDLENVIAGITTWKEIQGKDSRRLRAEILLGSGVTLYSPWEILP